MSPSLLDSAPCTFTTSPCSSPSPEWKRQTPCASSFWRCTMQRCRASSASVAGAPCRCRYSGEAHRKRRLLIMRRAFRRLSGSAPKRIARSIAALHQVDRAVRHFHLHLHLRIALGEGGDDGRDRGAAEAQRRVHAQQAPGRGAAARDRVFHLADAGEDARPHAQDRSRLRRSGWCGAWCGSAAARPAALPAGPGAWWRRAASGRARARPRPGCRGGPPARRIPCRRCGRASSAIHLKLIINSMPGNYRRAGSG